MPPRSPAHVLDCHQQRRFICPLLEPLLGPMPIRNSAGWPKQEGLSHQGVRDTLVRWLRPIHDGINRAGQLHSQEMGRPIDLQPLPDGV
jgi:hypothetical protein